MKNITFTCVNFVQYDAEMTQISQQPGCWIGSVVFGQGRATWFPNPSKIPYTVCGDCPPDRRGYWHNGKLCPFPEYIQRHYENSCLGCE